MTEALNDAELVSRVRDGETEAFTILVNRYQNAIYGLAYHHLANFEDARDVAQETFIRAYSSLHLLKDPHKFGPWLRQVAVNQCRMSRRQQRSTEPLEAVLPVSDATEQVDTQVAVRQALSCLSEPTRLTVTLFYTHSFSLREIAAFLEVPVTTVKSRLRDARARLKKEMWAMVEDTMKREPLPADFAEKLGRIVQTHHTFVQVQFTPGAVPELFTVLKVPDGLLQDDFRLAVVEHLDDGLALCITLPPTYALPGLEAVTSEEAVDVNVQSDEGATALSEAVVMGSKEIVRTLLDKGADVNLTDKHGSSPLVLAAMYNHLNIALMLLEHGADVNAIPEYRNTALTYAAWRGNVEMVKALLAKGADVSFQTPSGITSRMVAEEKAQAYLEVAELLKQAELQHSSKPLNGV